MVQSIDYERKVFAHIAVRVIRLGEQLFGLIYEVRGDQSVEQSLLEGIVKSAEAVGEDAECRTDEDTAAFLSL